MTTCGPYLTECTCRRREGVPRTRAEIDADHRQAVKRAIRSGWAGQPVPVWVLANLLDPGVIADLPLTARVA